MNTPGVVCVAALRSPLGRFGGGMKELAAYDIAAQVGVNAETILVDNGSTDGSAAYVAERILGSRSMVYLGEISFGLYLLQKPAI